MPAPTNICSAGASAARRVLLRQLRRPTTLLTPALTTTTTPTSPRSLTTITRPQTPPTTPLRNHNRTYHSHQHPPPPPPFTPAEQALLSAAYTHVPTHGFTATSLSLGARDIGLLDISPSILPDGGMALVRWHLYSQRVGLAGKVRDGMENGELNGMSVSDKVEWLAWERLRGNEGVVGRWQEALALMAQPSYVPHSLSELTQLADEILYLAGDLSVDPSWYTKRASLSAIYAAAELFQTADTSPGFRETRGFLRRRLDEAAQAGGAVRAVGEWVGFNAGSVVNVLRSKGVRI